MRIGQAAQLVLVVFRRLMVARLADLDRQQVVRNLALVHDDIGRRPICRSHRRWRRSIPAAAAASARRAGCSRNRPPSRKTAFRDAPPADASGCVRRDPFPADGSRAHKIPEAPHNLVQFGLHVASEDVLRHCEERNASGPGNPRYSAFMQSHRPGLTGLEFIARHNADRPLHLHFDQPRALLGMPPPAP